MLKSFLHRVLGDFVKNDPLRRRGGLPGPTGGGLQMPGYGFPLPVGVGSQIDAVGGFAGLFDFLDQRQLFPQGYISGRKILFQIHAHLALGQVPHMTLGGRYHIAAAQNLPHGAGLGRGFDDNQLLAGGLAQAGGGPVRRRRAFAGPLTLPGRLAAGGVFGPA